MCVIYFFFSFFFFLVLSLAGERSASVRIAGTALAQDFTYTTTPASS
jgi:hypothetical protein